MWLLLSFKQILREDLNDWEVCDYEDLLKTLASQQIIDRPDRICWLLEKKENFAVCSYYNCLVDDASVGFKNFPWKQIWKVRVPPHVAFFAWEACWERILPIDKLRNWGRVLVNGCYYCLQAEESCNHLLLWCPLVYSLWCLIYGLVGIDWVVAGFVEGEIWAWDGLYVKKDIANLILLTVFWVIWNERNDRTSDSVGNRSNTLKNR